MSLAIHFRTDDLTRALAAWSQNLSTRIPERVADILRKDVARQFQIGGEPRWVPLSPLTIREKIRSGYPRMDKTGMQPVSAVQGGAFDPANVLIRTRTLFNSYTNPSDPDHIEEVGTDHVYVGSSVIYAATHQYGRTTQIKGKQVTIPARPLTVSELALSEIVREFDSFASEAN